MNPLLRDDDALFAALLERWAAGDFTRSDEETLHRLLANDPFRREAWKGFVALPAEAHAEVLERIKQQLAGQPHWRYTSWLPLRWIAAAIVLLLLGALYWWWTTPRINLDKTALTTPAPSAEEPNERPTALKIETSKQLSTSHAPVERVPSSNHVSKLPIPLVKDTESYALAREHVMADASVSEVPRETAQTEVQKHLLQVRTSQPEASPLDSQQVGGENQEVRYLRNTPPAFSEKYRNPAISAKPLDNQRRKEMYALREAEPRRNAALAKENLAQERTVVAQSSLICPADGWPNFIEHLKQAALFQRDTTPDSLLLRVRIQQNGFPVLLGIEPEVRPAERHRLQQILQRHRWMPADTSDVIRLILIKSTRGQ
ncbi:MAG: hypothetical protein NZM43_03315 [Saprospiraceae bacterium]|nr:hypothetical protein [Saprospiraceae bacterium]MDW8483333.1 hypothetical protein [Saprospiraceae bacterium]